MPSKLWDVVVIGGGPGGATAGGLLAKAGHDVLILEKEHFPRFHIGESLLPAELPIFERLGFDVTRAGFGALRKGGAEFHNERTGKHGRFLFDEAMPGTRTHAFQVERAPFDEAMLANAERPLVVFGKGATWADAGPAIQKIVDRVISTVVVTTTDFL